PVLCCLRGFLSDRPRWFLLPTMPLALALDVRPTQLALIPALLFVGLTTTGPKLARVVSLALAVASRLPLWWLWGGLLPPTQRSGTVLQGSEAEAGINLPTLIHLTTVVGFLAWPAFPALIPRLRRAWWPWTVDLVG